MRELRLDVLAHLDRALVEKCFTVIEEIDSVQGRPDFVDNAPEQIEVEHAALPGTGDAGFRRAAGLGAGNIAGGRALDEHPARHRLNVERADWRRLVLLQRQLEGAIAAELRSAAVEILAQPADERSGPDVLHRRLPRIAKNPVAVRIRATAHQTAVAEHHED